MSSKTQETPSPSANKVREWGFSPALMEKEKTKGKKFSVIATLLSQSHMTCLETAHTLLRKSHAKSMITSASLAWLSWKHWPCGRVKSSKAGPQHRPDPAVE